MSIVPIQVSPSLVTLDDVLASVGQIPQERVRHDPPPGLATEDDILRIHAQEKRLCELVDGILVEKVMGAYESLLALEIAALLREFVMKHDLGIVLGEGGMLRLWRGRVCIPDACFISWSQLPEKSFPRRPIPSLHPDLAVEVFRSCNTRAEMHRKLHDYFQSGSQLVWYLDPDRQEMSVYSSPTEMQSVGIADVLDGGKLLPGLRIPMASIFRVPRADDRQADAEQ